LIIQEGIFFDLQRWGGSTILRELYEHLLAGAWQPRRSQQARLHNELGEIYDMLGNKGRAHTHYEQAWQIFHELEERSGEVTALTNLGSVCRQQGSIETAIHYYQEA
jgi:tetratricopeptide (TPR) repeat protein